MPENFAAYRIVVFDGQTAHPLQNSRAVVSLEKGRQEYASGLTLGLNRSLYSYIENPHNTRQLLLSYKVDKKDKDGKPDGNGEVKVKAADLVNIEELYPENVDDVAGVDESLPAPPRAIFERLNFDQLLRLSDPRRLARASTVRGPALEIDATDAADFWYFNFKSFPSTTGLRHRGMIEFIKPRGFNATQRIPLEKINCVVDCCCPDFRYRWAWSNKQRGASRVGDESLNQAWNQAPRVTNPENRPGLCKHLLALRNYLYGQFATFQGDGVDAKGMKKVLKYSKNRWVDFTGEVAAARSREKLMKATRDAERRDPKRPVPRKVAPPARPLSQEVEDEDEGIQPGSFLSDLQRSDLEQGAGDETPDDTLEAPPETGATTTPVVPPTSPRQESSYVEFQKTMSHTSSQLINELIEAEEAMPPMPPTDDAPPMGGGDDVPPVEIGGDEEAEAESALDLLRQIRDLLSDLAGGGDIDDVGEVDGDIDLEAVADEAADEAGADEDEDEEEDEDETTDEIEADAAFAK